MAPEVSVKAAGGRWITFLDGDALPHPQWLAHHLAAVEAHGPDCLSCGAEYSLPSLEYLQDPETGTVVDGEGAEEVAMDGPMPSVLREYLRHHRTEMVVTANMVNQDFAAIEAMAREGGYPLPGADTVVQQTRELLSERPDSEVAWLAFYPHNGMMPRDAFLAAGGFDEGIAFSEGWELAWRLQQQSLRPVFVDAARTYHLYHHHPFADPVQGHRERLVRLRAVEYMATRHDEPRCWLLPFWQAGIWPDPFLPEELVLPDLYALDRRWSEITDAELEDCRCVMARHPLYEGLEADGAGRVGAGRRADGSGGRQGCRACAWHLGRRS